MARNEQLIRQHRLLQMLERARYGKTLAELAKSAGARGVFLRKITRGATATDIPILPNTQVERGDILTIVGRTPDVAATTKMLGVLDRVSDVADVAFIGAAITIGTLVGAVVYKIGSVPLTLSTAGGALISGLFLVSGGVSKSQARRY